MRYSIAFCSAKCEGAKTQRGEDGKVCGRWRTSVLDLCLEENLQLKVGDMMHDIKKDLLLVFRAAFKNPDLVESELVRDQLSAWDSLQHVKLVVAIEERFSVRFELFEILSLDSFVKIEHAIREKLEK